MSPQWPHRITADISIEQLNEFKAICAWPTPNRIALNRRNIALLRKMKEFDKQVEEAWTTSGRRMGEITARTAVYDPRANSNDGLLLKLGRSGYS